MEWRVSADRTDSVYDGDGVRPSDGMPFGDECKGHWVFTASAKIDYPPEVVDRMGKSDHQSVRSVQWNVRSGKREFLSLCIWRKERNWMRAGSGPEVGRWGSPCQGGHISAAQAFGAPQPAAAHPQNGGVQINPITGLPMYFFGVFRLRMFKRRRYGWGIIYR